MRYPKHEKVPYGLCGVCGHYGNDCLGIPSSVLHPKHTPTPWTIDESDFITGPKGHTCIHSVIDNVAIMPADAKFIVRAVNRDHLFEELLAAARAGVAHLMACEKGQIRHPFKSAALPLLIAAIAEAEKKI